MTDPHLRVLHSTVMRLVYSNHLLGNLGHPTALATDRKSTRLNSSHPSISYAVFCLKKKNTRPNLSTPFSAIRSRPAGGCSISPWSCPPPTPQRHCSPPTQSLPPWIPRLSSDHPLPS